MTPRPITREALARYLKDAGWSFKRQARHSDLWIKRGTPQRLPVPRSKTFTVLQARIVLRQAGLATEQIEAALTVLHQ